MNALWAAWAASTVALMVGAYFLGRWQGRISYIDEVWDVATSLGAAGQVMRDEAAALGITVQEMLALEDAAYAADDVEVADVELDRQIRGWLRGPR